MAVIATVGPRTAQDGWANPFNCDSCSPVPVFVSLSVCVCFSRRCLCVCVNVLGVMGGGDLTDISQPWRSKDREN